MSMLRMRQGLLGVRQPHRAHADAPVKFCSMARTPMAGLHRCPRGLSSGASASSEGLPPPHSPAAERLVRGGAEACLRTKRGPPPARRSCLCACACAHARAFHILRAPCILLQKIPALCPTRLTQGALLPARVRVCARLLHLAEGDGGIVSAEAEVLRDGDADVLLHGALLARAPHGSAVTSVIPPRSDKPPRDGFDDNHEWGACVHRVNAVLQSAFSKPRLSDRASGRPQPEPHAGGAGWGGVAGSAACPISTG